MEVWAKLETELNERADFLKDLINGKKLSMAEMTLELRAFYARKYYHAESQP